jgi:hypothetical protein
MREDGDIHAPPIQVFDRLISDHFPAVCALWLHAALFLILASLPQEVFRLEVPPPPLDVELVTEPPSPPPPAAQPSQGAAGSSPPASSEALPAETPEPTAETARIADPASAKPDWRAPENWIAAGTLRAASVLGDPRSAQARKALLTVTGADRREQLCALEAMEQVRADKAGFRPTRLMPHALKNTVQRDGQITAPAGALRSHRNWYEIAYRCQLNPAGDTVESFEYALGPPIPAKLWDDLGLAAIH